MSWVGRKKGHRTHGLSSVWWIWTGYLKTRVFSLQQTCPRCRGAGRVISDPCVKCHGQGRVQERKTLSVKVPAGVDTGDRIRLSGQGEAGPNGGPSEDLYVQIQVSDHPHLHARWSGPLQRSAR